MNRKTLAPASLAFAKNRYRKSWERLQKALQSGSFSRYAFEKKLSLFRRLQRYERQLKQWGIAIATSSALLFPFSAAAQNPIPVGSEFELFPHTVSKIAMDSDGDFALAYTDLIYPNVPKVQRFDNTGATIDSPIQLNNAYGGGLEMGMRNDGRSVTAWVGYPVGNHAEILARVIDNSGAFTGDLINVTNTLTINEYFAAAAMDNNGNFVIIWLEYNPSSIDLYGQMFNNQGAPQGGAFLISDQFSEKIAVKMDDAGNFVVVWHNTNSEVKARKYNSAGVAQGNAFSIAEVANSSSVAMDSDGDFVVAWENDGNIYARQFNNAGVAQGNVVEVHSDTYYQSNPVVAMDNQGDFVIAWSGIHDFEYQYDTSNGFYYDHNVYARAYSVAGQPMGDEFTVNTNTINTQHKPKIAMDDEGDFIVAWISSPDQHLYAQRFELQLCTPTDWYADTDGDGYGDANVMAVSSCEQPPGTVANHTDCNDSNSAIHPGQMEICNGGIDDDCNIAADDFDTGITGQNIYFSDLDHDGYGGDFFSLSCEQPPGTVTNSADCFDEDGSVNPAAQEICNDGVDDDCDGSADNNDDGVTGQSSYYNDLDEDGFGTGDAILSCSPPPGTVTNNDDCHDANPAIYPGAIEVCNANLDDDCDGLDDNDDPDVTGQSSYYNDLDEDGFGAGDAILACVQPPSTSLENTDCNDNTAAINPSVMELCNPVDDNCDGELNEGYPTQIYYRDIDGDGKGDPNVFVFSCYHPTGYVTNGNDCDDLSATACPKPSSLTTSNITDVSATVSWGFLPCATSYRLEYRRKTPPVSDWTVVYLTSTSYEITGLTGPNIQYQWRIATICSPGGTSAESGYATMQSFNTRYKVYTDMDWDNFGTPVLGPSYISSFPQAGFASNQNDCNDGAGTTYPGAPELCNGVDDDCDMIVDEGANWFLDADGDGLGNLAVVLNACLQPTGYVANSVDCNDNNNTPSCATPTGFTVTNIGMTIATFQWTASFCASSYNAMYRNPAGVWSTAVTTSSNSYMFTGLAPNTTYQGRIRAKCPTPNTVPYSTWIYFTFTTWGTGLMEEIGEQMTDLADFSIYPNPGDGRFNLSVVSTTEEEIFITVTDGVGRIVYSKSGAIYEGITVEELDLSHLNGGIYQVLVRQGDRVQTKKVVVVK